MPRLRNSGTTAPLPGTRQASDTDGVPCRRRGPLGSERCTARSTSAHTRPSLPRRTSTPAVSSARAAKARPRMAKSCLGRPGSVASRVDVSARTSAAASTSSPGPAPSERASVGSASYSACRCYVANPASASARRSVSWLPRIRVCSPGHARRSSISRRRATRRGGRRRPGR